MRILTFTIGCLLFGMVHASPDDSCSSNGCVVFNNDDLNRLIPYPQVGITPVINFNNMAGDSWQDDADRTSLLHEIERRRRDWATPDTAAYLKHYEHNFASEGDNYAPWANQKAVINAGKSWIKGDLSELSLLTYPDQPDMVVFNFVQDYKSSNLSNRMKKRRYWIQKDNLWQIIYEGSA